MIHGELVLKGGTITTVDEDALRERVQIAVEERVYRLSPEVARWVELGSLVKPKIIDFYRQWYETPVEPASAYNARFVR